MKASFRALALAVAWLLAGDGALAHERSASHATWKLDERGADVTLRIAARDLTRPRQASRGQAEAVAAVAAALPAWRGGAPCLAGAEVAARELPEGRVALGWRIDCPRPGPLRVESRLPFLLEVPHLTFLRVVPVAGEPFEAVLHADEGAWDEPRPGGARSGAGSDGAFAAAFFLGLRHIAAGLDHLLFVLGLLLLAGSAREVAVLVTAFTAAHALTLAAATLGWLRPPGPAVEALIALTIALLAVECLCGRSQAPSTTEAGDGRSRAQRRAGGRSWLSRAALVLAPPLVAAAAGAGRVAAACLAGTAVFSLCYLALAQRRRGDGRLRWLVVFAFGLLHGFGFAGSLAAAGFSRVGVAATLVGFHLGVEAGQLLFVLAAWPVLAFAGRAAGPVRERIVQEAIPLALLAAATCLYAERAFG